MAASLHKIRICRAIILIRRIGWFIQKCLSILTLLGRWEISHLLANIFNSCLYQSIPHKKSDQSWWVSLLFIKCKKEGILVWRRLPAISTTLIIATFPSIFLDAVRENFSLHLREFVAAYDKFLYSTYIALICKRKIYVN